MTNEDESSLLEFPCRFPIKAMGRTEMQFRIAGDSIVGATPNSGRRSRFGSTPSKAGNYVSVTAVVKAPSQEQLDAIYQDLTDCEQVLMALERFAAMSSSLSAKSRTGASAQLRRHSGICGLRTGLARDAGLYRPARRAHVDELWLVQHPPVFTQGQAGKAEHVLAPGDIPVIQVDRGGQVTYHGPGQIVAYPLLDIRRKGIGVREFVNRIEESIIRVGALTGEG